MILQFVLNSRRSRLVRYGKVTREMTEDPGADEQFRLAIEAAPTGMIMVDERGRIVLVKRADGGGVRLVVRDDGMDLPADLDAQRAPSLGLHLVRMLARQLDAQLEVETAGGTCFRLTVPAEP